MSAPDESGAPPPRPTPAATRRASAHREGSRPVASDHDHTLVADSPPRATQRQGDAPGGHLGAYEIAGRLGAGGMGDVLEVVDPALARTVAAKVMRGTASVVDRRRFLAEARITGELEHPNIVPVHALVAEPEGPVFFTMKRVQGEDLVLRLARIRREEEEGARRPSGSLRELMITYLKILDAVGFAHARGVVHRDLKPANVMCGGHGEVYVCDWGLAKRFLDGSAGVDRADDSDAAGADPLATQDGTIVGTPAYMPPEQARGEVDRPDPRSDIYGLGAILYELLTFAPPYYGATAHETIELVDAGPPVPPRKRSPTRDIPRELEAVVLKAMARDRARRYPDVASLAADIEAFLDGGFIGAARYGPRAALAVFIRRHRLAAAATLAVALTLGVSGLARAWTRHVEARRHAARVELARGALAAAVPSSALEAARALVQGAAPALVAKERPASFAEHGTHLAALRALKRVADAAGEVLVHEPGAAGERAVAEDALVALAELACLDGDHALAEFALGQARALGAAPERVGVALRALEADRLALRAHQRGRVEARLAAARAGELEAAEELARAVVELAGMREPETLLAMTRALDGLRLPLRRAIAEALGAVAVPTAEESARGERTIVDLDEIVAAWIDGWRWAGEPPGQSLGPDREAELARALARYEDRGLRAMSAGGAPSGAPRWTELVARAQSAALPGGSQDRTVELASAVLGELGDSPGAVEALARHLVIEYDLARAVAAGRALARLAGRDAMAERALLAFVGALDVPHAMHKWDAGGAWWARVRTCYRPLSAPSGLPSQPPGAPVPLETLLDRGNLALVRRDYDAAEAAFSQAAELAPTDGRARRGRAVVFIQRGDHARALEEAELGLATTPAAAALHLVRATALRRLGRIDEARAAFARALELNPEDAGALVERAKLHREAGDRKAALADLAHAIALDPRRAQAYVERGRVEMDTGNHAQALTDYDQALDLAPDDGDALMGRANARAEVGNIDGALADLDRAIVLDPASSRAHGNRGRVRLLRGELELAEADLERALVLDPQYVKALINRASLWRMRKEPARAEADLDRALALAPASAEIYAHRGAFHAAEGHRERAAADLDRALELDPDSGATLTERGKLRAQMGDVAGAERDFTRAAELAPRDAKAWWNLATLAMGGGNLPLARARLDRAIELAPHAAELFAARGEVIARLGDPALALVDFERALALDARLWQVECLTGTALAALNRPEEAAQAFGRARAHAPASQVDTVERMRANALGR